MTQEMARGFSLFKEALLIFEIQDPTVESLMRVTTATKNAAQCYHVTYDEQKWANAQLSFIFLRGKIELNPAKNQNLGQENQVPMKLDLGFCLLLLTIG